MSIDLFLGDFAPVGKLSQKNVAVVPIRLPSGIRSSRDKGLKQTLTSLRSSHSENIILHSMQKDVVNYTLTAVGSLHKSQELQFARFRRIFANTPIHLIHIR